MLQYTRGTLTFITLISALVAIFLPIVTFFSNILVVTCSVIVLTMNIREHFYGPPSGFQGVVEVEMNDTS